MVVQPEPDILIEVACILNLDLHSQNDNTPIHQILQNFNAFAEAPVKFQNDSTISTLNPAASSLYKTLW